MGWDGSADIPSVCETDVRRQPPSLPCCSACPVLPWSGLPCVTGVRGWLAGMPAGGLLRRDGRAWIGMSASSTKVLLRIDAAIAAQMFGPGPELRRAWTDGRLADWLGTYVSIFMTLRRASAGTYEVGMCWASSAAHVPWPVSSICAVPRCWAISVRIVRYFVDDTSGRQPRPGQSSTTSFSSCSAPAHSWR